MLMVTCCFIYPELCAFLMWRERTAPGNCSRHCICKWLCKAECCTSEVLREQRREQRGSGRCVERKVVVVAVNTSLLEMQTYTEMEDCFWCWSLNHPFQVSSRHVANVRSAMFSAEGGHAAQAGPRHQDGERDEGGERARLLRGQAALRTLIS